MRVVKTVPSPTGVRHFPSAGKSSVWSANRSPSTSSATVAASPAWWLPTRRRIAARARTRTRWWTRHPAACRRRAARRNVQAHPPRRSAAHRLSPRPYRCVASARGGAFVAMAVPPPRSGVCVVPLARLRTLPAGAGRHPRGTLRPRHQRPAELSRGIR